jgi:CelD/BcsL family acetyltransferase involved in cellulose biosynthesis
VTKALRAGADAPNLATPIRLEPVPSLGALDDEWSALAHESGNVFSTLEWTSTWWRHYGDDHVPLIFACRGDDDRLVALLPLYLSVTQPVRAARFIGHGPADQLGPICPPSRRGMAAGALRSVCDVARIDVLLAELLPGGEAWEKALGGTPLVAESSPTISLARGWEEYLATRSANFRQQVRGRERKLMREHSLRFRLAADPTCLQHDLDILFSLHGARWGKASSAFLRWERFHREFAALAHDRGWLRLWFLDLDDRPVAAWYGFRFAGIESYYQAGRDPKRSDESVGFVLLAHTIREAADDGMREYRLLRGAEAFKFRFANADPGLRTFVVARGIRGRIAGFAVAAGLRSHRIRLLLRRLAVR